MCHREKISLKYNFHVNRFKRDFIVYREDGLREEYLSYTECMEFRQAVGGIKSAGGDACGVVTPSVLNSMFRIVFLCIAGVDYNAISAGWFCFRLKQIRRHPARILDRNAVGIAPYFVEGNDFHFVV